MKTEKEEKAFNIICLFEDWLQEHGVTPAMIPCADEREGEEAAIIYGEDFDNLMQEIVAVLIK